MPTYVYETIPQNEGEQAERFEMYQSIHADALKVHPDTQVPVRRVILGGIPIPKRKIIPQRSSGDSCCGTNSSCGDC